MELGKWGLGPRDLVANVNFFSRVDVAEDGSMTFVPGNSKAGDYVELRAEMNVLAILNTCQHPLDPNPKYRSQARASWRSVKVAASRAGRSLPPFAPRKRARLHANREVFPMRTQP